MGYELISKFPDEIKQNIKMILLCSPGEYPGDPNFGCGLNRQLFETIHPTMSVDIKQTIQGQIEKYMPRIVRILDVIVEAEPNALVVTVKYEVPSLSIKDVLDLKFR
jgi:phage baseplate assembly protein W